MDNKECHRYNHYKLAILKIIGNMVVILWFSQSKIQSSRDIYYMQNMQLKQNSSVDFQLAENCTKLPIIP